MGTFSGFYQWDPMGTFSGFYLWDPMGTFSGFYLWDPMGTFSFYLWDPMVYNSTINLFRIAGTVQLSNCPTVQLSNLLFSPTYLDRPEGNYFTTSKLERIRFLIAYLKNYKGLFDYYQ